VLAAAEQHFADKGYEACRLEDVAAAVGIRRASLVYHFRDKRTLYETVVERLAGDLLERYRDALEADEPVAERLVRLVRVWVEYVTVRPAFLRIFLRELAGGRADRPFLRRSRAIQRRIADLIRQGQDEGTLLPGDPFHMMNAVAGASLLALVAPGALVPGWPEVLGPKDVDRHLVELLRIICRLLGLDLAQPSIAESDTARRSRVWVNQRS
jgi:TetR/AcrR family transcriptional regulator